jgi:hypothetical protein
VVMADDVEIQADVEAANAAKAVDELGIDVAAVKVSAYASEVDIVHERMTSAI